MYAVLAFLAVAIYIGTRPTWTPRSRAVLLGASLIVGLSMASLRVV